MCDVIPGYACLVCVVMHLRLYKKFIYFTILCFNNLFLCRYAYVLCNASLNTPIACSLVCFPGMTSSLAIVNKSLSGAFFLKFPNCLMFLNTQIDLFILKTYYGQVDMFLHSIVLL